MCCCAARPQYTRFTAGTDADSDLGAASTTDISGFPQRTNLLTGEARAACVATSSGAFVLEASDSDFMVDFDDGGVGAAVDASESLLLLCAALVCCNQFTQHVC